ncbi:LuxR C-terminal-related transcriptional regulator (plasmid) [Agrobacterium leguminum]|uniref:helix-turn-helix transcriptional regulator n=1 Tax=Agrobacterium leguminum TaxID=2792015 RepID=UPI00272A3EC8|nr:LuxR family transcriptional regulator [Agrobacterium leguminum]WLE00679.1 LuxR C-terminal-related transcriptional regulator [Agrobacterium leguminum]
MTSSRTSGIAAWHASLPDLVNGIGADGFYASLDERLRNLVSFDLSCIFVYGDNATPRFVHDGLNNVSPPEIMENYLNGTYLFDAVYDACCRTVTQGLYRLKDLAPDNFFQGDYYNSPEFHPCISMETGALSEEIVFLVPVGEAYLAYSLLRQRLQPPFPSADFELLTEAGAMVAAMLAKHWQQTCEEETKLASLEERNAAQIGRAFETFARGIITSREQAIVSMILRGHSSLSTAQSLGISEGTVKNHRKNIYAKLRISSQTELFRTFIDHLFKYN